MARKIALALAVADPGGHFVPGLERLANRIRKVFSGVGALVTTGTADEVTRHLSGLGAHVAHEASGVDRAGRHRRRSVQLAIEFEPDAILYGDLDHVLRWIESDEDEIRRCLQMETDFVVVGRTEAAMAACPRRLRDTERVVNHIYELMTGRDWDLMFGLRLMSARAAEVVVDCSTEDTLANDVEWPLLIEARGFGLGYFPAAGLSYRTTEDFDAAIDAHDRDPALWIARIEIAAQHVRTMSRFAEH